MTQSISEKIRELKKKRNAVILAHNYQRGEVQDIADFTGDSLGLSIEAAKTEADVIVFCGVNFMAETAKILSPDKKVLVPDPNAGCPLANMITPKELREEKAKHPQALVVAYVNTSAEVKALSDLCCTSGNAVKVVRSIPPEREIIFIPDKSLGRWVSKQSGREMFLWDGYCPTHHRILPEDIEKMKRLHAGAKVAVHPECLDDVVEMADSVGSTSGIAKYCRQSPDREFIIGTEVGMLHRLRKENPDKAFFPASVLADCPDMKLNTLEKILWSLEDMVCEVKLPEDIITRARDAIERMIRIV